MARFLCSTFLCWTLLVLSRKERHVEGRHDTNNISCAIVSTFEVNSRVGRWHSVQSLIWPRLTCRCPAGIWQAGTAHACMLARTVRGAILQRNWLWLAFRIAAAESANLSQCMLQERYSCLPCLWLLELMGGKLRLMENSRGRRKEGSRSRTQPMKKPAIIARAIFCIYTHFALTSTANVRSPCATWGPFCFSPSNNKCSSSTAGSRLCAHIMCAVFVLSPFGWYGCKKAECLYCTVCTVVKSTRQNYNSFQHVINSPHAWLAK